MIGLLIFSIICCLICVVLAIAIKDEVGCRVLSFLAGAFMILGIAGFVDTKKNNMPTALDVYQGKTTLKYEVIDGVKVDSVVIWKENVN